MSETRSFPRLSLACDVEFGIDSPNIQTPAEKVKTKAKDISRGGICLITYSPLNKGDILWLKFRLQGYNLPIKARGKIMWTQSFLIGNQQVYDNGIEFIEIDEDDRHIIDEFIDKKISL